MGNIPSQETQRGDKEKKMNNATAVFCSRLLWYTLSNINERGKSQLPTTEVAGLYKE